MGKWLVSEGPTRTITPRTLACHEQEDNRAHVRDTDQRSSRFAGGVDLSAANCLILMGGGVMVGLDDHVHVAPVDQPRTRSGWLPGRLVEGDEPVALGAGQNLGGQVDASEVGVLEGTYAAPVDPHVVLLPQLGEVAAGRQLGATPAARPRAMPGPPSRPRLPRRPGRPQYPGTGNTGQSDAGTAGCRPGDPRSQR